LKNLFGETVGSRAQRVPGTRRSSKKAEVPLGCEACPLDKVAGLNKVINIDKVTGRKAMLWAQCPGANENTQRKELVGKAGAFLWDEMRQLGLSREDFDVQNVVRCWPRTSPDGNTPNKLTIKCCSIFNHQAIDKNHQKAVVHLILGKIAGVQLLGKAYSKAKAAIWHEPWQAYVVVADHPSRILRMGGRKAGWAYYAFKDKLKAVKAILNHPGRWGYVNAQDYKAVLTPKGAEKLRDTLLAEAKAGHRIGVDIEDGEVDGKKVVLMIGFAWGEYAKANWAAWRGTARSVVLYHPEAPQDPARIEPLLRMLQDVLEDPSIVKVFQHGSYDVDKIRELLGIRVKGYDFDTQYATYLRHPGLRTYGLESLVGYFFQEFADYKSMVAEYSGNYALCPLGRLVTYNCADADLTKRIEVKSGKVNLPLLRTYIHAAFTLGYMEGRGPILDRKAHKILSEFVAERVRSLRVQIQLAAEDPTLNPNTPQQIAKLLYDKLQMPLPVNRQGKTSRSTGKDYLEVLAAETKSRIPRLILDYRTFSKMESTYLLGFQKSADLYDGELRTIWWLTGAISGRLRSISAGTLIETFAGALGIALSPASR